jgi:hypothetical protein
MMHCSYQLSPSTISKKACLKHHTEAFPEDLMLENFFNFPPKKKFSICRECPVRKRLAFFYSVDSRMTSLV